MGSTEVSYRAATWQEERRVVLVVCERPGELYLHSFFIVTSFTKEELSADDVVDFYRDRGPSPQQGEPPLCAARDAGRHVEDGGTLGSALEGAAAARADRRSPLTPTNTWS